jgi:hypothetical protein
MTSLVTFPFRQCIFEAESISSFDRKAGGISIEQESHLHGEARWCSKRFEHLKSSRRWRAWIKQTKSASPRSRITLAALDSNESTSNDKEHLTDCRIGSSLTAILWGYVDAKPHQTERLREIEKARRAELTNESLQERFFSVRWWFL